MVKFLSLALLSLSLSLYAADVPKQGNSHLVLGGQVTVIQSAGTATLDGSLGQTFLVPTGPTNASLTLSLTNFRDGQQARVVVLNTSTNNTRITYPSGLVMDLPVGRTNVVELTYSTDHGSIPKPLANSFAVPFTTNSASAWPTNAPAIGASLLIMSNNVLYLLTSTPTSASWAATNRIGP